MTDPRPRRLTDPARRQRLTGPGALGRLLLGHLSAFRNARLQDVATGSLRDGPDRRAWVLTVVNGSLRVRRALTYACYLRPKTVLSRLRFAPPGGVATHRLSLLCPTRGRVRLTDTFLRSLQRTAAAPERIEALFYVDADDPELDGYRALFADAAGRYPRLGRCVLHVGEPVGVPAAWNALAAAASGDLLLMANDDQLYVDYGWDVRLDQRLVEVTAEHPDGVCCLYFEAGQYPDGAADFPILSRPWYEALGYFTPTIFQQWEVETWVFDLARRVDRLFAVPGVFVEHRHYQDYKAPFDETYQLHRMTREKSFTDHALFLRTARSREQDAAALRRRIDGVAAVDPSEFWFADYLRQHLPKIRAEVAAALRELPAQAWAGARLYEGGRRDDDGCAAFPVTAGIVEAIPEATTFGRGVVRLARLPAGATMVPGRGLDDSAVRVLIGVVPPDPATGPNAGTGEPTPGTDEPTPGTGTAAAGDAGGHGWPGGGCLAVRGGDGRELRNQGAGDAVLLALDVSPPEAAGG